MMGLSELKAAINLENDGVASSERQRIMKWTIDDVMSHVRTISPDQAKVFGEQVRTTLFLHWRKTCHQKGSDKVNIIAS